MRQSGAKLVEVGTTNCTYAADYEQAISPHTAALLRVHSSNFQVVGFTHSTTLEELTALGQKHNLPVFDDLGSGCLLDTTTFGLGRNRWCSTVWRWGQRQSVFPETNSSAGRRAGIIVGKKQFIDRLRKHPLARVMRIDKIRLAGLAATLISYLKGQATREVPVWVMIAAPLDEIERRANQWAAAASGSAHVIQGESMVGGGSLPEAPYQRGCSQLSRQTAASTSRPPGC